MMKLLSFPKVNGIHRSSTNVDCSNIFLMVNAINFLLTLTSCSLQIFMVNHFQSRHIFKRKISERKE